MNGDRGNEAGRRRAHARALVREGRELQRAGRAKESVDIRGKEAERMGTQLLTEEASRQELLANSVRDAKKKKTKGCRSCRPPWCVSCRCACG